MTIPGSIIFHSGTEPKLFSFRATADGEDWRWTTPAGNYEHTGRTWRFTTDAGAVEFCVVCDSKFRAGPAKLPACDRIVVVPVKWRYPCFLVTDYPAATIERMRLDHWFATKAEMLNNNKRWPEPLRFSSVLEWGADFFAHWAEALNWLNRLDGPGGALFAYAQIGKVNDRVDNSGVDEILKCINFRMELHSGANCRTFYLKDCHTAAPTEDAQLLRQRQEVEAATAKNIAELAAVREHFTINTSYLAAAEACLKQDLPPEFVAFCMELGKKSELPTVKQALLAVQKSDDLRAVRETRPFSHTTVSRWLRIVREELDRRKLRSGKGQSVKPVSGYDIGERHRVSPPEGDEPDPEDPGVSDIGLRKIESELRKEIRAAGYPVTRQWFSALRAIMKDAGYPLSYEGFCELRGKMGAADYPMTIEGFSE
jgi:hypothetical protein